MAGLKRRTIGFLSDLKVREAEGEGESRTIEGYALKFGVRSRLLCDWWDYYYEVLEPGCITREMLDEQDIKLTMFHDRELILARSKEGNGTLSYELDETGVKFWAEMPFTDDGNKALELIKRGDISGCSFIYSTDEADSENAVSYERLKEKTEDGQDILLRHVKRIDHIYDFTVTPDPAFAQTEVTRREVEETGINLDPIKSEETEEEKRIREQKEKEEAEALAREKAKAKQKLVRELRREAKS